MNTKRTEIQQAVFNYDFSVLSKAGKRSAESRKNRKKYNDFRTLREVMQKLYEANEHICSADN